MVHGHKPLAVNQYMSDESATRSALNAWIRALEYTRFLNDTPSVALPHLLDDLADVYGDRPALIGGSELLSYRELAMRSNAYASWAVAQGLVPGDVVGLLMPNCPEYVAIWLGLTRAGCTVALLNTTLVSDGLLHCIRIAQSRNLIVTGAHLPIIASLAGRLPQGVRIWVQGKDAVGYERIMLAPHLRTRLHLEEGKLLSEDRALLIYTSGTTGLPKAANVTHARTVEWSFWFAGMMDVQPTDRLYNCLPMYHSVGGVVAIGAMLVKGGSVLISERFSATRFWNDVVDGQCTIFQYIGELCRYLTMSKPHPQERLHRLRLACGNGMQDYVWAEFQRRFAIPQILEFYAATEGNVSLYNCEGKPGAIGRVPKFLAKSFPVQLIRIDPDTGDPSRDKFGRCMVCEPDQPGEAIGKVVAAPGLPARRFDGYTDQDASAKKILHDVFSLGDRWFRTGDLMRRDRAGYFYFLDRLGDTFRWKGENVATTEVAAVLRSAPGITDAVVYGVAVPGHEGRAGMAAVMTNDRFNFAELRAYLLAELPAYARPVFVRLCESLNVTGTFKLTKEQLAKEGFADTAEPVWLDDQGRGAFVRCGIQVLQSILSGERRL
jgi:fatty-acyl-CoA synthase